MCNYETKFTGLKPKKEVVFQCCLGLLEKRQYFETIVTLTFPWVRDLICSCSPFSPSPFSPSTNNGCHHFLSQCYRKETWWLTNRKIVEKYIKDARSLIATQEESEIASALNLLDAALAISPRLDQALELRARSLLYLRRFKDVADMLQDYIPSLRIANDDSSFVSSDSSGF